MRKLIFLFLAIVLIFTGNASLTFAAGPATPQLQLNLLLSSPAFVPALFKGIKVDINDPLKFTFLVDTGQSGLTSQALKDEAKLMTEYFLAALTIPRQELWVNLSPYENDRIVSPALDKTAMGKDLLGQDYLLKQLAASLTYPGTEVGRRYWDEMNNPVGSRHASTVITGGTCPSPTSNFQKVWIMPDKARVYQEGNAVFITEARLKVMTEEDCLAMKNNNVGAAPRGRPGQAQGPAPTDAFKQHILPLIEKEVNEGKNFARLRQIYYALILALWYKDNLKTMITQNYADKGKTNGINNQSEDAKEKIYQQYVEAFKKGAYDYIRKESVGARHASPVTIGTRIMKRRYFSGGFLYQKA